MEYLGQIEVYGDFIKAKVMNTSYMGFKALGPLGQLSFGDGPDPEFVRDNLITILQGVVTLSGMITG